LEDSYDMILKEKVLGTTGNIKIANWPSHSDSSITHMLSYNQKENVFIDFSIDVNNNIIERKEIDGNDIEKYSKWYTKEILEKMVVARNQSYK